MKKLLTISTVLLTVSTFAQRGVTIPQTASPEAKAEQSVGLSIISIEYSRPSVVSAQGEDRTGKIWGQLVPYELSKGFPSFGSGNDFPWRAGANKNTVITFSHDAKIEDKSIAAGAYGFHVIPHEDSTATLIFSSNSSSWGSFFYDESEDVLRVDIKTVSNAFTNRLTYDFIDLSESEATVCLDWENLRFPFKVSFESAEIIYQSMSDQLRDQTGFGWEPPYEAAQFCIERNIHLDQAEKWLDQSIVWEERFDNLYAKSQLLSKQGKNDEAEKLKEQALAIPSATSNDYFTVGNSILADYTESESDSEKKKFAEEALAFFEVANKKFSDEVRISFGLAKAYSAVGDYKKAIKVAQGMKEMTENERTLTFIDGLITQLEAGEDIN